MTTTEQMLEHRRNKQAQAAALSAVEGLAVTPTGIVQYSSRGRLLVIGSAAAQQVAAMVEPPLHAQLLLLEGAEEPGVPVIHAGGRAIRISGHLGAFRIELGDAGKPNHQLVEVDLVLDLGDRPLIQRDIPPPGYWSANNDPLEVEDLLAELQEMTGTFEKPRFFNYDPDICAHSRAGREGCSRCLESCPAEAIVSIGDQVQVDPNLCQGGGICATVCPTGAMRYADPGPEDSGLRLRLMLMHYRMAGGTNPVVLLVAEADVSA
ncbi:MAG: 4Fe-4S binding protein, partial [Gammaproteobacteria bacterium]